MDQSVVIEALIQVARKRRLLGQGPSARLGEYAKQKGIANLDDLRRWLAAGDGLSAHLANQLLNLIPRVDTRPFGAYIPLAHLADGGMGTVWLACAPDNKLVVVKTLKSTLPVGADTSAASEFIRRFQREARITQQLTHANIVRCIDNGQAEDGTAFMVLEYVASGDLRDLVELRGGLPEGLALAILYQVVDGLAEAHRIHLIHRDIKPPNIFVGSDGRAKLADFGIARSTEESRTMLTMEGAIVGSPLYMSPEQIVTDPNLDIRSDIYALGAVLYYCLAATAPFDGKLQEVLHKHCTASVPDIRKLRPVVSETTAQIIATCMQKERGKRYKDPDEMRASVANALVKLGLTPGATIEEETRQGDLSAEAGFVPRASADAATIASNLRGDVKTITANLQGDKTLATDLSGRATISANLLEADSTAPPLQDVHTIAANLLALADETPPRARDPHTMPTIAAPLAGAPAGTISHDLATAVTAHGLNFDAARAVPPPGKLDGDLATAIATDWISLLPATPGDPAAVLLFARAKTCLGKLREPPVDLCLRNYPVVVHKEACQRVSRQHLNLRYDGIQNECQVEDMGGPNGTMLDGITIKPGKTAALEPGVENILVVANTIALRLRPLRSRGEPQRRLEGAEPSPGANPCGIDTANSFDALIVTRPENRPEMAYALVLRRLTVGGPGAELPCAGARTRSACEIGLFSGRWIWRPAGSDGAWKPLAAGTELDCGGKMLSAQPGSYNHF